jgi:hypothetical protein
MARPPTQQPGVLGKAGGVQTPAAAAREAKKNEQRHRLRAEAEELSRGIETQYARERGRFEALKRRLKGTRGEDSGMSPGETGDSKTQEQHNIDKEHGQYYSLYVGIYNKILHSIATGTGLQLEPNEIPRVDMPEDVRQRLAQKWAADIAEVAAGRDPLPPIAREGRASDPALRLPDAIPEEQWYKNRPEGQTLRQWLGLDPSQHPEGWVARYIRANGLTRPDLRRLDLSAYGALYNTKTGRDLLGLLPSKAQLLDEELSHVDRERIRDARRLDNAERRRRSHG